MRCEREAAKSRSASKRIAGVRKPRHHARPSAGAFLICSGMDLSALRTGARSETKSHLTIQAKLQVHARCPSPQSSPRGRRGREAQGEGSSDAARALYEMTSSQIRAKPKCMRGVPRLNLLPRGRGGREAPGRGFSDAARALHEVTSRDSNALSIRD
jgi:hypothetical protein